MKCNVCNNELGAPIYKAASDTIISSLCESSEGKLILWLCEKCAHIQGKPIEDVEDYYDTDYKISLASEEDDQLYEIKDGLPVFRNQHQVATLFGKLHLGQDMKILDYGCAKGTVVKNIKQKYPSLDVHMFDISTLYIPYWKKIQKNEAFYAAKEIPQSWVGSFDVVTSFFVLEHIPGIEKVVNEIYSLLKNSGTFYGIVPNTFTNIVDFLVLDHVNHFTESSLTIMLEKAGFIDIKIDSDVHRGAFVFTAFKKDVSLKSTGVNLEQDIASAKRLANYWMSFDSIIKNVENSRINSKVAIYGSGFYGTYVANLLEKKHNIVCFLDSNPHLQGTSLLEKPIYAPEELPDSVEILYVGLNPRIARSVVENISSITERNIEIIYLPEY